MKINSINDIAINTHEQIQLICKPIFDVFSIKFFRYVRIFPDGSRIHLCTHPEWTEYFYAQRFYNVAWYDAYKLKLSRNFEVIWDEKALKDDNIVGMEARNRFKFYHGISIIRAGYGYYEIFDFATDDENTNINDMYIKKLDVFEHFLFYFRDQASHIIADADKKRLQPVDLMQRWKVAEEEKRNDDDDFFKKTEIKRFFINTLAGDTYLTKKEVECVYWSTIGKSAEEISLIIGSAKRTVEIHLENVRQKLGCSKLSGVIKLILGSGMLEAMKAEIQKE